jgi:hypothetical protein
MKTRLILKPGQRGMKSLAKDYWNVDFRLFYTDRIKGSCDSRNERYGWSGIRK